MSSGEAVAPYQSYRGLPSIAGLCSMERAQSPGLSVDQCVTRMKRHHYAFQRLHEIFIARITAEPIYELKTAFSLHGYLCAEHVAAIRTRVGEMREPPLGLDVVPHAGLEIFFDEILAAPGTIELVAGLYEKGIPALIDTHEAYLVDTNPFVDAPSVRVARFALLELYDMAEFGRQAVERLIDPAARASIEPWLGLLDAALQSAGGIEGTAEATGPIPARRYSAQPYQYDRMPRRDERFQDPFNAGVNPEAFLYDEKFEPRPKTLMMYYKRLREIDVPEMMASIIHETKGKPWAYYLDMTRQLWDEARHAMMGEVGFVRQGIDWTQIPINFTWSRNLNTQLTPIERHAVLYFIEQGLMPKTGKRFEWEVALKSGDPLSGLFQDFDWADEVLHASIGREWYVKQFANLKESMDYGDRCWTKVVSHWRKYLEDGLTEHRNWWPEVYAKACDNWGIAPDPAVLSYSTTYETQRADLKDISASG